MLHPANIEFHPPLRTQEQARKGLAWARSNLFEEHERMMQEIALRELLAHESKHDNRWVLS